VAKTIFIALIAAVLVACTGESTRKVASEYAITPLPKDYKKIVADYLKPRRTDRGAIEVGNAYQHSCRVSGNDRYYGWAVPVTYGGKKRARVDTPQEIIWFNNNSVQMVSNGEADFCSKA
jgi:hypothetical protein